MNDCTRDYRPIWHLNEVVNAAIEKLPEEERAAAKKLIEAKRENPNSDTVATPAAKPSKDAFEIIGIGFTLAEGSDGSWAC